MKRSPAAVAATVLVAACALGSMARSSNADRFHHHHGSLHGQRGGLYGTSAFGRSSHFHHHHGFSSFSVVIPSAGCGWGSFPYPYRFHGVYGLPTYPLISPSFGYPYLGPLYIPAEELYGPRAIARFFNPDPFFQPAPVPDAALAPPVDAAPVDAAEELPPERPMNAQSIARSQRYLALGDKSFADQKYSSAFQRYAQGILAAPRLEAYLRQGFTLIALGHYDRAAHILKRGADVDANLDQSNFRLDDLYGPNRMAKQSHLDALAKTATDQPDRENLLFLLGMFLHFDGQTDRAKLFFQRAAQLTGEEPRFLVAFLD